MTARTEPTVSKGFSIFSKKVEVKSPEALAADALQAFTDAQEKLNAAQQAIGDQIADHAQEIKDRQAKLDAAKDQHSRLERVKNRFAELLA